MSVDGDVSLGDFLTFSYFGSYAQLSGRAEYMPWEHKLSAEICVSSGANSGNKKRIKILFLWNEAIFLKAVQVNKQNVTMNLIFNFTNDIKYIAFFNNWIKNLPIFEYMNVGILILLILFQW